MGFYINQINGVDAPRKGKAEFIAANTNTLFIEPPTEWREGLVCVIDNGVFDAAGYAYDEDEMRVFLSPDHNRPRPRQWLLVPEAKAIVGYKE